MTNPTETHESVLAEMRDSVKDVDHAIGWPGVIEQWANRLAAAHARDVGVLAQAHKDARDVWHHWQARAEAAKGLLREALPYLENTDDEGPSDEGYKSDALRDLIARIAHLSGGAAKP